MEPSDYLAVLSRRRRLILAVVGVTMLAAVAASYLPAAKWTGTTIMRLEPSASISGGNVRADDVTYLDRLINTYSRLVDTDQFRQEVAREAGLAERPTIDIQDVA